LNILTQVIAYDTSVVDLLAAALVRSQNNHGKFGIKVTKTARNYEKTDCDSREVQDLS